MTRSNDTSSSVDPFAARLAPYLYVADLIQDRRVLEVECGDGRGAEFLANHGARHVVGVDPSRERIEDASRRHRLSNLEFRCDTSSSIELEDGAFDCILVPRGAHALRRTPVLEELRRLLASDGTLVLSAPSADRPMASGGVSYYEFVDRLEPLFSPVRMVAQSPFVAMSLVEYAGEGVADPDIALDTSLREEADDGVTDYVAICGGASEPARGFTIVQLPTEAGLGALSAAMRPVPERREQPLADETSAELDDLRALLDDAETRAHRATVDAEHLREQLARSEKELAHGRQGPDDELAREQDQAGELETALDRERERTSSLERRVRELESELAGAGEAEGSDERDERTVSERIGEAMLVHAERVRELEAALEERQAFADELADELERARAGAVRAEERSRAAEAQVLEQRSELAGWRTRTAVAEGELLRLREGAAPSPQHAGAPARDEAAAELRASRERVRELEVELARARDGGGDDQEGMVDEAEARLSLVAERLRRVERQIDSEKELLAALETGLRELYDEVAQVEEGAAGWVSHKEEQLKTFSHELGTKDAELALLHVGLSSIRERLREVVAFVRDARREMEGRSAPEMLELMDRLTDRLSVYEGMADSPGAGETSEPRRS